MKVLNINMNDMFRPLEGEYNLTFVPSSMGANYVVYKMHWMETGETIGTFPCLPTQCPICRLATSLPSEEAAKMRAKTRVLINVWEGNSKVKIWDASLWLLSKGMGGDYNPYNPIVLEDSRLWDPSKYGLGLSLIVRRRARFPEYIITKSIRRFEIPEDIIDETYNLKGVIYRPSLEEITKALDEVLNFDRKIQIQRTESVGEAVKKGFAKVDKIEAMIRKKRKVEWKAEYQEPEPYKRARRIVMDEED